MQCWSRSSAARSRSSARRRCCPSRLDGWPVDVDQRSRRRARRGRRRLPAAHPAASASARRCSRRCASTARAGASPTSAPRALKPDTLVMHPGPMNRGVEIADEVADSPAVARDRAGRERCRGAHGGALVSSSAREVRLSERPVLLIRGGTRHRRDRRARRRRARARRLIAEVGPGARRRRRARRVLDAEGCGRRARARRHPGALPRAGPRRRRRRSRPARAPPRSAGSPRWCACRTPTPPLDDAAVVQAVLERGRRGLVRRDGRGLHHAGPRGRGARADRRALRPRRARVHRRRRLRGRRRRDAPRVRVRDRAARARCIAQHAEDPDARARRAHARGGVVGAARHPGPARGGRVDDRGARPRSSRASPAAATTCCTCRPRASAELVRAAKATGVRVTAECTPQHFTLTDEACASFDPVFKMNPPLRDRGRRRRASSPALVDGTIDAIATDHAPHTPETKERAVRGGAARDARRRDRARGRDHHAGRARAC